MYIPGQALPEDIRDLFLMALNDTQIKAELSKQIRTEVDTHQSKTSVRPLTYESLVSGDVNMQYRMAASGYDVYGRTIVKGNGPLTNHNSYKKMKNQIKYGTSPSNRFRNRGSSDIT